MAKYAKQIKTALEQKFELDGDGWTIYKPQFYYNMGLPKEFVDQFNERHDSGNTFKSTITNDDGEVLKFTMGVYNLTILYGIAKELGCETGSPFIGRGYTARWLVDQIQSKLSLKKNDE